METEGSLPCSQDSLHLSLSWARWIQIIPPHPISEIYHTIILHLHLGLPSGLFFFTLINAFEVEIRVIDIKNGNFYVTEKKIIKT
jgi:hypothetical protein